MYRPVLKIESVEYSNKMKYYEIICNWVQNKEKTNLDMSYVKNIL